MKKIILCILIILALFFVVSCDKTVNIDEEKEINLSDIYFIRRYDGMNLIGFSMGIKDKSPVKINPLTQKASFLCTDPVCNHDDIECPLYNCANFYVTGNYLFYTKRYHDKNTGQLISTELGVYDMLNGTVRRLAEYKDEIGLAGATQSYLYYYIAQIDEENESSVKYIVNRVDAKTGNIIEILLNNSYIADINIAADYPKIYTIIENKIYWRITSSDNSGNFYTTDLDGTNEKIFDFIIGKSNDFVSYLTLGKYDSGYVYHAENNMLANIKTAEDLEVYVKLSSYERELSKRDQRLSRITIDGIGEIKLIVESFMDYIPCGDKIYYTVLEENPEFIEDNGVQTWNWSGGKIYVMNSDGTKQKLLCETGYNLSSEFIDVKTIDGIDYLAWSFNVVRELMPNEMGAAAFSFSPDTIIINASTGEYAVVSMPE